MKGFSILESKRKQAEKKNVEEIRDFRTFGFSCHSFIKLTLVLFPYLTHTKLHYRSS